mgnify:CR=1 FL=1
MANKVTITDTKNNVTITPQSNTTINTSTTNTPVTVIQGTTSVVTVNTPGPIGPQGNPGASPGLSSDIEVRNITASSNISSSNTVNTKFLRLPQAGGGGSIDGAIYFGSSVAGNNGYIYDDNNSLQLGYNDGDILTLRPNIVQL